MCSGSRPVQGRALLQGRANKARLLWGCAGQRACTFAAAGAAAQLAPRVPLLPYISLQLEGLQALVDDAKEDEEMKRMAREERGVLLEEVRVWASVWVAVGQGGKGGASVLHAIVSRWLAVLQLQLHPLRLPACLPAYWSAFPSDSSIAVLLQIPGLQRDLPPVY